ncbi:hypothetical protein BTE77_22305 [Ensifer adhaerens]|jgi:hypothetical protein|nr:hypothetical protein BTE77_22305 [Ensifer adhaerens]
MSVWNPDVVGSNARVVGLGNRLSRTIAVVASDCDFVLEGLPRRMDKLRVEMAAIAMALSAGGRINT